MSNFHWKIRVQNEIIALGISFLVLSMFGDHFLLLLPHYPLISLRFAWFKGVVRMSNRKTRNFFYFIFSWTSSKIFQWKRQNFCPRWKKFVHKSKRKSIVKEEADSCFSKEGRKLLFSFFTGWHFTSFLPRQRILIGFRSNEYSLQSLTMFIILVIGCVF